MIALASSPLTTAHDVSSGPLDYLSASRLKAWGECSLKFKFRYIDKLPTTVSPALFVGKAVHEVLRHWNLRRWRGEDASLDVLNEIFEDYWIEEQSEYPVSWSGKEDSQKQTAWNMLEHYLEHTPVPVAEKPEAVEVVVERDFEAAGLPPLRGVIDLVRQGGRIVDFKTAARSPDLSQVEHQNEIQLSCYAVLYREATGHQESGMELHHLVKTKTPKLIVTPLSPMSPDQARRLTAQMESYVDGVQRGDFVPSPGMHCSWCDYFQQCRAWKGGGSC